MFEDVEHDSTLAINICNGRRPPIEPGTQFWVDLMIRCWDSDPSKQPDSQELSYIGDWWAEMLGYNDTSDDVI
jgi:hypothetical protein